MGKVMYRRNPEDFVVRVTHTHIFNGFHTYRRIWYGAFGKAKITPPSAGTVWGESEGGGGDAGDQAGGPELLQHADLRGLRRAAGCDERVLSGVREAVPAFARKFTSVAEPGAEDQEERVIVS